MGNKVRIGILGAADIAIRRFLPALKKAGDYVFAGVAVSGEGREQRAREIVSAYGGKIYIGYENLLKDTQIDAVYIPQPPSLHYRWARMAIGYGKHVLLEKPGTTALGDMEDLVGVAREAQVALAENYAFCYHDQVGLIRSVIESGELGRLRLIRAAFGFPHRRDDDFRYQASLGGGALLDCGGYVIKAARLFLGESMKITDSFLLFEEAHDVDIFGCATLRNETGLTAQVAFGMDNSYKCELELWGSRGHLLSPRFFTPPAQMEVELTLQTQEGNRVIKAKQDDQFLHMAEQFCRCIRDPEAAFRAEQAMLEQMALIHQIQRGNGQGE